MAFHNGIKFSTTELIFWIDSEAFNGGSTVKDLVNGNVGTCTNVTKHSEGWFSFGSNANKIDFAGNSALAIGTGDFTAICWFYPTQTNADGFYRRIWMWDGPTGNNTNNPQMILDKVDGSIYSWSGGDLDIQGGSTSIINGWHSAVMIRDGSTITQYIDNVADGTDSSFTLNTTSLNSGSPRFRVGSYNGGSGDYEGNIASVMIYSRALDTEERTKIFNDQRARFGI